MGAPLDFTHSPIGSMLELESRGSPVYNSMISLTASMQLLPMQSVNCQCEETPQFQHTDRECDRSSDIAVSCPRPISSVEVKTITQITRPNSEPCVLSSAVCYRE